VRPVTALVTLLVTGFLAAPVAATASSHAREVDRGVVQSVAASHIVLRELDGTLVALAVAPGTRVFVNGRRAAMADLQPGFVAAVTHDGTAPATAVRAFGRVQTTVDHGVVVSRAGRILTIRTDAGPALTFRLTLRTTIRFRGLPAGLGAVRAGRLAAVTHTPAGEAVRVVLRAHKAV